MTDHKFTDEEIIKALDCCSGEGDCENCPAEKRRWSQDGTGGCTGALMRDALSLINRQKAEIERFEKENNANFDKWKLLDDRTKERYAELYKEAKVVVRAKAMKEFAEELRRVLCFEYRGRFSLDDELAEYKVKNAIEWVVEKMTEGK